MGVFGDAFVVLGKWLCLVGLWSSSGWLLTSGQIYVTLRDEKRELMVRIQEKRKIEDDRL